MVVEAEERGPHESPDEAIPSDHSRLEIASDVARIEISDTHEKSRTYEAIKFAASELKRRQLLLWAFFKGLDAFRTSYNKILILTLRITFHSYIFNIQ